MRLPYASSKQQQDACYIENGFYFVFHVAIDKVISLFRPTNIAISCYIRFFWLSPAPVPLYLLLVALNL